MQQHHRTSALTAQVQTSIFREKHRNPSQATALLALYTEGARALGIQWIPCTADAHYLAGGLQYSRSRNTLKKLGYRFENYRQKVNGVVHSWHKLVAEPEPSKRIEITQEARERAIGILREFSWCGQPEIPTTPGTAETTITLSAGITPTADTIDAGTTRTQSATLFDLGTPERGHRDDN